VINLAKFRKSKTDTTYFMDIPKKKDDLETNKSKALALCKALANYTSQRSMPLDEIRDQRKKIYNLSLEINRLHEENERLLK
jgi:nucleoid-associated protein YejK